MRYINRRFTYLLTYPLPTPNLVVLRQMVYVKIEGNPQIGERWASPHWGRGRLKETRPSLNVLPC